MITQTSFSITLIGFVPLLLWKQRTQQSAISKHCVTWAQSTRF